MHIRYARLTGALAATLLVSACAGDRATSELVTGIPSASLVTARTGSAVSLRVRDSVQLTPVNLKRSVRWNSSNPGVAGVSPSGVVVGVAGGTAIITASGGNGLERTTVSVASVTPTVTSLTLSPGTAQLSTGGRQQFAVSARWSDGSAALPPVTYSATGGTISSTGLYTAGSLAGTFMVVATCACGVADTSAVAIQTAAPAPTVTALRISPKDVSVAASATVQLSTTASWSNGATTLPPISYTALDGGTVNATSGAFVAPATAGRYRVVVSSTATPVRDTASITVAAPQLVTLRIAPRTSSVAGGASVQFSATASWSTGATTLPPVTYQAPDGGSINASSGLWVAPATSGTFRVIVAHTGGSLRDTATITVTGPRLVSLRIAPRTSTITAGATVQFSATALWETGATTLPPVTYVALNGGTVNASTGLFVAPSTAGTYRVAVRTANNAMADTATVTITTSVAPPPPAPSDFTRNMPANVGLQLFFDSRFGNMLNNQLNSDSIGYVWNGRNAIDATAPYGPNVFETFYPGGSLGNGEGGAMIFSDQNRRWRRVYFSLMMWVPSNYSTHSNEEKFWYPLLREGGALRGYNLAWWPRSTPNSSEMSWKIWRTPESAEVITTGAGIPKGRWTKIEIYMEMNTVGSSNGVLKIWVDNQVSVDISSVRYSNASVQAFIDGIRFDGTRGGGASNTPTPPGGQVRRYNRLAFYFGL